MGLFAKAEYVEVVLPFTYDYDEEDVEACVVCIEAYGRIHNEYKYCYASFDAGIKYYDELSKLLRESDTKLVKVIAKLKNDKVKDFKIDLKDLAERLQDKRLEKLSLVAWGLNDHGVVEHKNNVE